MLRPQVLFVLELRDLCPGAALLVEVENLPDMVPAALLPDVAAAWTRLAQSSRAQIFTAGRLQADLALRVTAGEKGLY